jgi:hypothetical protein
MILKVSIWTSEEADAQKRFFKEKITYKDGIKQCVNPGLTGDIYWPYLSLKIPN